MLRVNDEDGLIFPDTREAFESDERRDGLRMVLQAAAKRIKASRMLFVTESWCVWGKQAQEDLYAKHDSLKDVPGRTECLMFVHETPAQSWMDLYEIVRGPDGSILKLETKMEGPGAGAAAGGRFVGIIQDDYDKLMEVH